VETWSSSASAGVIESLFPTGWAYWLLEFCYK
jgi:hypothetical protein